MNAAVIEDIINFDLKKNMFDYEAKVIMPDGAQAIDYLLTSKDLKERSIKPKEVIHDYENDSYKVKYEIYYPYLTIETKDGKVVERDRNKCPQGEEKNVGLQCLYFRNLQNAALQNYAYLRRLLEDKGYDSPNLSFIPEREIIAFDFVLSAKAVEVYKERARFKI